MLNDFGDILDTNWRLFSAWLKKILMIVVLMTGFRYLWFESLQVQKLFPWAGVENILELFFTGFRFDLMICGFLLIPIVFILLVRLSLPEHVPNYQFVFYSTRYGAIFWAAIVLMSAVDSHFVALYHRHMRKEDWAHLSDLGNLTKFVKLDYDSHFFISVFAHLALAYLGFRILLSIEDFYVDRRTLLALFGRQIELILKLLLPLIIVAFLARGTLGAHHLGARHSEVSDDKRWNELVFNPMWTFNKPID